MAQGLSEFPECQAQAPRHCLFVKYFLGPSCGPGTGGTACQSLCSGADIPAEDTEQKELPLLGGGEALL